MLDTGYFTRTNSADVQTFWGNTTTDDLMFQTWKKPRGCSMHYMICIGSGAGGGGGFTAAAAAARGGGGGGGSSATATLLIPSLFIPDILYVQVGMGGLGVGSGGGTAGSGIISYIALGPDNTNMNNLLASCVAAPTGGGTGTGAAVGAAGTGGTVATHATCPCSSVGVRIFQVGKDGIAGGAVAGAAGGNQSFPLTNATAMTMGGAGGAGTTSADFAGGAITAIANCDYSAKRPVGAAAGSNDGSSGFLNWAPFLSYCGLGGASSNAGVGGKGGLGGPGSGGGGGGGGTTGGKGGDGGPGLVVIVSW